MRRTTRPLFKPDTSATLAMHSPLYKRIEDGLTEQSQLKTEHDADQARMRNAAVTANVPLEPLRQMMTALIRETQPPAPATEAASSTLNNAHMQVDNAQGERLLAEQQSILTDNQNIERDRAVAASVTERLGQTFATPSSKFNVSSLKCTIKYGERCCSTAYSSARASPTRDPKLPQRQEPSGSR